MKMNCDNCGSPLVCLYEHGSVPNGAGSARYAGYKITCDNRPACDEPDITGVNDTPGEAWAHAFDSKLDIDLAAISEAEEHGEPFTVLHWKPIEEAKLDGTRYFVFGPLHVVWISPRTPNAPRYHPPQVDIAHYEGGNWQAGLFNAVIEPTMFAEIKEPKQ